MAKNVHRYKAGGTGSTVSVEEKEKEEARVASEIEKNSNPGFFLKAAIWILSRFPLTKHRYQNWTSGRRILIGWLLWLICLPIIPLAIAIVWFVNDPSGFKKSPLSKVLIAVIVAWFGFFGLVATEPSQIDVNGKYSPIQTAPDGEDTSVTSENEKPDSIASAESREKIANQTESRASDGREFKNCSEAFEAGVFNIKRSDKSYQNKLDRDNDGIACEK